MDGGLDVDSLTLTASEDISKLDLTISKPALSNKKDSDLQRKSALSVSLRKLRQAGAFGSA